jgi:hypothetical protein
MDGLKTEFKVLTVVLILVVVASIFAIAVPTMAGESEEPSGHEVPGRFRVRGRFRDLGVEA